MSFASELTVETQKEKRHMKRTASLLALFIIAVCVLSISTWAQKPASNTGPKYDLTTETKLNGTVETISQDVRPGEGTHLMLKTASGPMLVHVAPELFLKDLEVGFNKGDQLEVIGSKLKIEGVDEVLAKQITRGDNTMTLRDKKGVPVWDGWMPAKK
jgi:hypothetical protein